MRDFVKILDFVKTVESILFFVYVRCETYDTEHVDHFIKIIKNQGKKPLENEKESGGKMERERELRVE